MVFQPESSRSVEAARASSPGNIRASVTSIVTNDASRSAVSPATEPWASFPPEDWQSAAQVTSERITDQPNFRPRHIEVAEGSCREPLRRGVPRMAMLCCWPDAGQDTFLLAIAMKL